MVKPDPTRIESIRSADDVALSLFRRQICEEMMNLSTQEGADREEIDREYGPLLEACYEREMVLTHPIPSIDNPVVIVIERPSRFMDLLLRMFGR